MTKTRIPRLAFGALAIAVAFAGLTVTQSAASSCVASPGPYIDVTSCGAVPNDSGDDSAAIQAANNRIGTLYGGRVYFPPGTYLANNIKQDSGVEFFGSDRETTIIKHSASSTNLPLIEGRQWETASNGVPVTGDISKGSRTLTVSNAAHISPGTLIAVKAAGGPAPVQATSLRTSAASTATQLNVQAIHGFATLSFDRYLVVGNEVVSYRGLVPLSKTITGVTRRLYGSPSTSHPVGTSVSQALRLVAEVVSVSGRVVTLDKPALVTVKGAPVKIGSVGLTVRGLTLDGNKPTQETDTDPWPLYYGLTRKVTVTDTVIKNGARGGMRLDEGTRGAVVENNVFANNGVGYPVGAAHLWMFRGAIGNVVRNNVMTGPVRYGIVVDDRSTGSSEYDRPSNDNTISNNSVTGLGFGGGDTTAVSVYGSDGNTIADNDLGDSTMGVYVGWFTQGVRPANSLSNTVSGNSFRNMTQGIRTDGENNTFSGSAFGADVEIACRKMNDLNTFLSNGPECPDSGPGSDAGSTTTTSAAVASSSSDESAAGASSESDPLPVAPLVVGLTVVR